MGDELFEVYVPAPGALGQVDRASGIVGRPTGEGRTLIHYEGNRLGAINIRTYADRCHHAADRMAQDYPTIATACVPDEELIRIGSFDLTRGIVTLHGDDDYESLAAWLGTPVIPDAELRVTRMA